MIALAASIVIYVAAVIDPHGDPHLAWFDDVKICEGAVSKAREKGAPVTDCVKIVLPAPVQGEQS